jgi:hypothetical protein
MGRDRASNTEFRVGILGALGIHSQRWKKEVFLGILGAGFGCFFGIVGAKIRHSRGIFYIPIDPVPNSCSRWRGLWISVKVLKPLSPTGGKNITS